MLPLSVHREVHRILHAGFANDQITSLSARYIRIERASGDQLLEARKTPILRHSAVPQKSAEFVSELAAHILFLAS